ncbi:hypothetical protein BU16DRAFT_565891 [Lophium mytilinum]|uniref:DJ-1/PfpI domain-containing protein n=1 Tax=Lophium mytilinum TaxID=390894 RepID=A0A6A6QHP0_9PEZI|nr:hypothetical protein BU16DRAFT_565891 [Lophium mytilinum]
MSPTPGTPYTHLPSQADLFYLCTTFSQSDDALTFDVPPPSNPSLRLGVLLLGDDDIPSLDLACIDVLSTLTKRRLEALSAPGHILELGIDLDICYLSENSNETFTLTNGVQVTATESLDSCQQLDILMVPSVSPYFTPSPSTATSLDSRVSEPTTTIMTLSTGSIPVLNSSATFIRSRIAATSPSRLLSLRQHFPETQWEERRWVNDGRLWSCSGGMAGPQMIAVWMREYFWDRADAVEWVLQETGLLGGGRR